MIPSLNASRSCLHQTTVSIARHISKRPASFRRFSTLETVNQEFQTRIEKIESTVRNLVEKVDHSERQSRSDAYKYAFGAVGAICAAAFGASHIKDKIKTSEEHLEKRMDDKINTLEVHINDKINTLEGSVNDKINRLEGNIEKRINLLEKNLSEQMKVSNRLAYLEGKGDSEK